MGDRNETLLREWFERIWNRGDVDAAQQLATADVVLHETAAGPGAAQGLGEFQALARVLRCAVPDIHFRIDDAFESGDQVAARLTVTGTHSGAGLGLAPTGRSLRINGIVIARCKGGRIAEGWSSFDLLGLFEQIGAVRRPQIG